MHLAGSKITEQLLNSTSYVMKKYAELWRFASFPDVDLSM